MSKLFFFTLCSFVIHLSVAGQSIKEIILPFDYTQSSAFEKDVQWVIDSIYYTLKPNEKLRFVLYSDAERKNMTYGELCKTAAEREKLVNTYLRLRKTVSQAKLKSLLEYDTTAIFNTYCVGNRSAREIQQPLGIPSVVIVNTESPFKYYPQLEEEAILRKPYQVTIACNSEQTFYTNSGVMLRVEENSFVTEQGRVPSCCNITFTIEEYFSTSDILLAGLVTHSSGRMLETGGMVYLEARCGNEKLKLAQGKFIYILLPQVEKKKGMLAFDGRKNENKSDWKVQQAGKVYVSPEETGQLFPQTSVDDEGGEWDSVSSEYYYEGGELADGYLLKSANLGWINCDRFYEIEEKTELAIKSESVENICYRLVFKNIRSILPAYSVIPGSLYKFDGLPKGESATLLGYWISKDRKQAYFAWKEIIIGEEKMEALDLKLISGGELVNLLTELFPV